MTDTESVPTQEVQQQPLKVQQPPKEVIGKI